MTANATRGQDPTAQALRAWADAGRATRDARRRPAAWPLYWLAVLPLALGAVVDLPRLRPLGRVSGLGVLTAVETAVAGLVLVACGRYPRRLLGQLAAFAAFLLWGVASTGWAPPVLQGFQNFVSYLLLGLAVASAGAVTARDPARAARAVEAAVLAVDVVGLALVAASLARQGWALDAAGTQWLVHPRSVAITGLVPVAWHLARWLHGRAWDLAPAALWVAAIFVSLSRMATITAVVLVAAAALQQQRARRGAGGAGRGAASARAAVAGLGAAAVLIATFTVGAFRERTFRDATRAPGGVASPAVPAPRDVEVNSSDRPLFWAHTAASAMRAPVVGQGIGSSQSTMEERWPGVGHPHNDYLRVWHDLGAVGLVALLAAFWTWGAALARAWRRLAARGDADAAQLALAGLLGLLALALPMVTDNALVYPFVVGPVGVLVGAGLGAATRAVSEPRRGPPLGAPAAPAADPRFAWWTGNSRYRPRRKRRR